VEQIAHRRLQAPDPQHRPPACQFMMGADFIFRFVGEEGGVGVGSPGCQAAAAADKQPMIRTADNAHEEGGHLVVMGDAVIGLAKQLDISAAGLRVAHLNWGVAEVEGVSVHRSLLKSSQSAVVSSQTGYC
jgi:hypothetical protein